MAGTEIGTIGIVVHPKRPIDKAVDAVRGWVAGHGGAMGQVTVDGQERRVADPIAASDCDVLVAMGGDGTVLAALHEAGPLGLPVLGVACGSLGALTSVKAPDVAPALDRVASGDALRRSLPALDVSRDGETVGPAFNDVVVMRDGAGQVILEIDVDGAPFCRVAGDGAVIATPLGSSAYTLAAGGPLVSAGIDLVVVTPLSSHGGSVPSVVLSPESTVTLRVDGGWAGARVELDGRVAIEAGPPGEGEPFGLEIVVRPDASTLVDLDGETLIAGLRRRGVIADSPRLAARDARERQRA